MKITENDTTTEVGICKATVICHSEGNLITYELVYPRYIHAEFMTHRMFSRNAMSSRATPVTTMIKELMDDPVIPPYWFKNARGMVGKELITDPEEIKKCRNLWLDSMGAAIVSADILSSDGIHKQHINRLLEPFSYIKVICTATEWENFFKLRLAPDVQPEMRDLAIAMKKAREKSLPSSNLIHAPYLTEEEFESMGFPSLECISAARCARVSYLKHDGKKPSEQEDLNLAESLIKNGHMTPFEHFAYRSFKVLDFYANLRGWKSVRWILENGK